MPGCGNTTGCVWCPARTTTTTASLYLYTATVLPLLQVNGRILSRVMFPLGGLLKCDVRRIAEEEGTVYTRVPYMQSSTILLPNKRNVYMLAVLPVSHTNDRTTCG
jgi:hypothetical protein